jgi:WD40 repeat protein
MTAVGAFDEQGRRVVGAPLSITGLDDPADHVLGVWDLDSGEERVFSLAHLTDPGWNGFQRMRVAPDGSVFAAGFGSGWGGVHRLTLPADPEGIVTHEVVYDTGAGSARFDLSRDGRKLFAWGTRRPGEMNRFDELRFFDLEEGTSRRITTHGSEPYCGALDPTGRIIASGGMDGVVRAGPATGEEPHLLFGHDGPVTALAISPHGRWIASASNESVRLWPMPDVAKPPFHTLPYPELMAKLRALTNLEVVADEAEPTGYRVEVGPFPGWKDVPTW